MAQEPPAEPRPSTHGELRWIATGASEFPVGADFEGVEGGTLGQPFVVDQRIRLGVDFPTHDWVVGTEWDLFAGQVVGETWDIPGSADARHRESIGVAEAWSFVPRKIWGGGRVANARLDLGLQTSHWGLGMVANDGTHDPLFGRSDFGDRVMRARATTKTSVNSPVYLSVAGDLVVEDDTADLFAGQVATQLVGVVMYRPAGGTQAGVYAAWRSQEEADHLRFTDAGIVDGYAYVPAELGELRVSLAAEGAVVLGKTSRAVSYNSRDALAIVSDGACGELKIESGKVGAWVRAAYASADEDPDDATSGDFVFDRDFDAGMVLFDQVQGAIEAQTYAQLDDPENMGAPPYGAETLVTEGALKRAAFLQPAVQYAIADWAWLRAGVGFAWATGPVFEPFRTARNGGVPTNAYGKETTGYQLGTEIDWAVAVGDVPVALGGWKPRPAVVVQGGHLLPGADLGLDAPVHVVMGTARVRW
jgi:hypothetical protein